MEGAGRVLNEAHRRVLCWVYGDGNDVVVVMGSSVSLPAAV